MIVKRYCMERGLPYQEMTYLEALRAVWCYLASLGRSMRS